KCLAHSETAAAPGVERARSPDAMLQAEARQLFVVGPEDVGTIVSGHDERTRLASDSFVSPHPALSRSEGQDEGRRHPTTSNMRRSARSAGRRISSGTSIS